MVRTCGTKCFKKIRLEQSENKLWVTYDSILLFVYLCLFSCDMGSAFPAFTPLLSLSLSPSVLDFLYHPFLLCVILSQSTIPSVFPVWFCPFLTPFSMKRNFISSFYAPKPRTYYFPVILCLTGPLLMYLYLGLPILVTQLPILTSSFVPVFSLLVLFFCALFLLSSIFCASVFG